MPCLKSHLDFYFLFLFFVCGLPTTKDVRNEFYFLFLFVDLIEASVLVGYVAQEVTAI